LINRATDKFLALSLSVHRNVLLAIKRYSSSNAANQETTDIQRTELNCTHSYPCACFHFTKSFT